MHFDLTKSVSDLVAAGVDPVREVARRDASTYVGSTQLLNDFIGAGWLEPTGRRNRQSVFDRDDLVRCWRRMKAGEVPVLPTRGKRRSVSHTAN